MTLQTSDLLSIISIIISVLFSFITVILNRKEDPNIIPKNHSLNGANFLSNVYEYFGDYNISNLSILINIYNDNLEEITSSQIQDKFLFVISPKSTFSYTFPLPNPNSQNFFYRVRFKGEYKRRIFWFLNKKFEQKLWFSGIKTEENMAGPIYRIDNTHKPQIELLEAKFGNILKEYEKNIDKKIKTS